MYSNAFFYNNLIDLWAPHAYRDERNNRWVMVFNAGGSND